MRKLLRSMAKAQMKKMGVNKINKRMRYNWRRIVGAYPINIKTGEQMPKGYHGEKKYKHPGCADHFFYHVKFIDIPKNRKGRKG